MASPGKNPELIAAADEFAAAVKEFDGNPAEQMRLLKQADKLRFLLESPMDPIMKQWEVSSLIAAMHLLVESGTLEKIPVQSSITSKELATLVGIDESAIGLTTLSSKSLFADNLPNIARAFRLAVMHGIGVEAEPNVFAHNLKSQMYLRGGAVEFFRICVDQMRAFIQLPEYFKTHTHDDLYDLTKSPYAYSLGLEGLTYYEAISHDPERLRMFNMTMMQMEQSIPILGMFPFASLKEEVEAEPERPFVVDIGGGRGQCLIAIQQEAPNGFGSKLILQDRPDVIGSLTPEDIPNIETMSYDFFTSQPVKNAHVYLLRRILHDFYEPVCVKILKNIADAMGPKSRLVVADMILPEKTEVGAELIPYWMDFSMMMLNGKEKSRKEFEEILDESGFEIVKVWKYSFGTQAQIECRLKAA
ncbi:hypothetical protein G7Y89_g11964 [Cudoniella acicularis]|uniref:O-methyltransferase C-terminal domain-containing protein n=1 Tax=Cudoniella acicularis TaxID=354080 RepID=A0A8H4RCA9_9HELO|nr:hypothetical protein G7Y89_g11964 [Cudoniella acicularis]